MKLDFEIVFEKVLLKKKVMGFDLKFDYITINKIQPYLHIFQYFANSYTDQFRSWRRSV